MKTWDLNNIKQQLNTPVMRGWLQRDARVSGGVETLPDSVKETLVSTGKPLDQATQNYMAPRFAHDFSRVRVHTDAHAAQSSRDVNANAYTVGEHIVFDSGLFNPATIEGNRLLAHELTHVVQQAHDTPNINSDESLERHADRAANFAVTGSGEIAVKGGTTTSLQRQAATTTQAVVKPRRPYKGEKKQIDAALNVASRRCQRALFQVNRSAGFLKPAETVRNVVQTVLGWRNPDMNKVSNTLDSMAGALVGSLRVMVAGNNDPECSSRDGYVLGGNEPIVLCPNFFTSGGVAHSVPLAEKQARTLVHEAAHLAGISNPGPGEGYCQVYDCGSSCPNGRKGADSWAHLVHCLSGQVADKPVEIQGRPGGSNTSGI